MRSATLLKHNFSSPFSKSYWRKAVKNISNIHIMALTSLFVAMYILFNTFFKIPVGQNLNIMINFIPSSLCGMIGGPFVALIYGFISDIIGFFLRPEYGFFPGYTLSTMTSSFIYAIFLFGAKYNVFLYVRIALSKLCVNVCVNILLNCLWSQMLFKKGYFYYLSASIVKNLVLLPIEIIIMSIVLTSIFMILRIKNTPVLNNKKK